MSSRVPSRSSQIHSATKRASSTVTVERLEGRALLSTTLAGQPLGDPGAGGQVTSLAVSPFDSKLVLGGGDILGIARSTDGGSTWTPAAGLDNGGGGQLVEQFTFHPTDPNIIWAGTMRGPYVSLDAGRTWTLQRHGMPGWGSVNFVAPIQKILFDPNDAEHDHLLAFTGNHRRNVADSSTPHLGEVWESIDGGANWTLKSTIVAGKHIENAVYKTGSPDTIYAVCGGNLYRSLDDGGTWTSVGTGLPTGNLTWVTISPNDGNRLFVATKTNGVWLSTDGGNSFVQKATGLRLGAGGGNFIEVDQNPNDGKEVLYFGYPDDGANGGSGTRGVYKSTNGGDSWTRLTGYGPTAYPNYGDIKPIAIDPNNADIAFFGTNGNIWRTTNGGASLQDVTATQVSGSYYAGTGWSGQVSWNVKFNPFNPNESAVLGMDSGKWISRDDQQTWIFGGGGRNKGLYDWSGALDIAFTNTFGASEVMYLTQGQNGADSILYKTINGGAAWTQTSAPYAIAAGDKREDYFKFDLSSLTGVTTAILRVKVSSIDGTISPATPASLSVQGVNGNLSNGSAYDTWSQSTATWNLLKQGWENATSRLDAQQVTAADQYIDLDVTSFIKSEFSGDKKATLKITEATRLLKLLALASSESGSGAQLIVNGTTILTPTDDTSVRDGSFATSAAGGVATSLELKNGTSGDYQGITADFNSPNRVWTVRSGRIFFSASSGAAGTWTEVGFNTGGVQCIAADPSDPTGNTIYAGADTGLWKTTDGTNFTKIGSGPTGITRIKLDPTNPNNIYVVATGLWRWNGTAWSKFVADDSISDVAVDPTNGQRIVYGTSYNPFQSDTDETGLWLSEDGGSTWSRQNRGLANLRAYNLAFKPGTSRLVVGTRDNGYYVTDLNKPMTGGTVLQGSAADFDIREGSGIAADGNGVVNSTTSGVGLIGRSDSTNNHYATVLVFQLPHVGAVAKPFTDAQLDVFLNSSGVNTFYAGAVDLYGLGVRTTADGQPSDYFLGSFDSTDATLISDNFYRFPDSAGYRDKTRLPTGDAESAALARYLNAQYAGGANAGKYVFLRLNGDATQPTFRTVRVYTANATDASLRPTITYKLATAPPAVDVPAAAADAPVTGTSTQLSVLGRDDAGESSLKYTWSLSGTPPAAVLFSDNGTNSAKNTTATFAAAGQYQFVVTITNAAGLSTTSSVNVTVNQTLTGIIVTPSQVSLNLNGQATFTAAGADQFGARMATGAVTWSLGQGSVGSVDSAGVYTAAASGSGGAATVVASVGGVSGSGSVTVSNAAPTVATGAAGQVDSSGTSVALSALGRDDGGEANLNYVWSVTGTPPAAVTFTTNGTNAAKNTSAILKAAGVYSFLVTITDAAGLTTTTSVSVTVSQKIAQVVVTPSTATVTAGTTRQLAATAYDQFATALAAQPTFTWSVTFGGGSVSSAGLYTAPATAGTATVSASAGGHSGSTSITITASALPAAPSQLTAKKQANRKVKLTWTDDSTNETGFYVQISVDGVSWTTLSTVDAAAGTGNTLTYITGNLSGGSQYFRVVAYNAAGLGISAVVQLVL